MNWENAMKFQLIILTQLWMVVLTEISIGTKNRLEEEHLSPLLKPFMLLDVTSIKSNIVEDSAMRTTTEHLILPKFEDDQTTQNITAQFGSTVILHCRVNDLSDKMQISWVKRIGEKIHLLSYGQQVYSSDQRFQLIFRQPNDWQLRIQYVNERDEGIYECQISTHPPMAITIFLTVIVPQLEIADERGVPITNKFYNIGSTIELKCLITKIPHEPNGDLLWRHGTRILNYDTIRGGISVKTEILSDGARSRLFVANVKPIDSGNYSCSLSNAGAGTSVSVQVLNGEIPAAMQHGGTTKCYYFHSTTTLSSFFWLLIYYHF